MSNADDNQGRRGLFRRNRSEEPVAAAPPSEVANPNPDTRTEPGAEADRKQNRRPALGRRKAATDESWSSDAWEDGWDDDWSDRSSRAGVRPAADPRPAEVDAWLASSDDQLGDITRDIARKWTGNKQPEPVNAAITWADEVTTTPARGLLNDPFADGPFLADVPVSSPDSIAAGADLDDLWDSPAASSDWTGSTGPADLSEFDADELATQQPVVAPPVDLGSTWDDFEESAPQAEATPSTATSTPATSTAATSTAATSTADGTKAIAEHETFEPTQPSEPTSLSPVAAAVDEVPAAIAEISLVAEHAAVLASVPAAEPEAHPVPETVLPATPQQSQTELLETVETPAVPTEMAFDFAGSTDAVQSPIVESRIELIAVADIEAEQLAPLSAAIEVNSIEVEKPSIESDAPAWNAYTPKNSEASVSAAPLFAPPTNEISRPETSAADTIAAEVEAVPAPTLDAPASNALPVVDTDSSSDTFTNAAVANDAVAIDAVTNEAVVNEATALVTEVAPLVSATPVLEVPGEVVTPLSGHDPIAAIDHIAKAVGAEPAAALPASSAPVERDEFLDSLYEELDDDDVPAERKIVHEPPLSRAENVAPQLERASAADPVATERTEAVEPEPVVQEHVAPHHTEPVVDEHATFAPNTATVDHVEETMASSSAPKTDLSATSFVADVVPQDPNADFDFGPDRPVYAPKVAPIAAVLDTATKVSSSADLAGATGAIDDNDLFPATKADRFATALDQLDDDQTNPSGLSEPVKKGFLRGRKNRKDAEATSVAASPTPSTLASSDAAFDQASDLHVAPQILDALAKASRSITSAVGAEKLATTTAVASSISSALPMAQDDLADLDDYDDLDAYSEEAYFSPKLTKLLARAGFLLVALAAIRMLVLVGIAVKDGAKDAQGTQDVFHRIGSAFAELGIAHGLMLIVGIALAAAPALLGDPYLDDESRSIGATFGIGLIAAIFGVFGGFAAARLALRVNDIADLINPGVSSTTKWAKVGMNLLATAGLSLVAVIAAVRALGGDRHNFDDQSDADQ
jgi:hypothetical protein